MSVSNIARSRPHDKTILIILAHSGIARGSNEGGLPLVVAKFHQCLKIWKEEKLFEGKRNFYSGKK